MNKRILGLALVALATVLTVSSCGKSKKIVFASDATWPPMEFVAEDKSLVGFDVEFAAAVAKAAGFELEVRNTAWDGIFGGLANGQYDAVISSVTITEERKGTMDFSEPYINAGQVIVTQASLEGASTLSDFVGKNVGAQIGTTGDMEIAKVAGVIGKQYDELGLAMEDLVNGRLDAVVCDTPIAANFALQTPQYKDKLKIVGSPFTEEYYGIAVKKGNKKLLDKINQGIAKVKASGELEALEAKWLK